MNSRIVHRAANRHSLQLGLLSQTKKNRVGKMIFYAELNQNKDYTLCFSMIIMVMISKAITRLRSCNEK